MRHALLTALALGAATLASPAGAQTFAGSALSDTQLAGERAGFSPFPLTTRDVRTLIDAETQPWLRFVASSGQTGMDVWWQTSGATLIGAAVRAAATP